MAATSLGVSVGAGTLTAAIHPGEATHWANQLTLSPHVAPEAGLLDENPRVRSDGVVLTGYVERVGDPVPIAGPGGQTFAAEQLLLDAVKSMVRSQLPAFDAPPPLVIACPAYWTAGARDAFAAAVTAAQLPHQVRLETDLTTAFARLRQLPDLPRAGLIALIDLGATGTTVGIGDAASGALVGDRVRLEEPNGTDLDHALLNHLLGQVADPAELSSSDPNLVAALERLRVSVRLAKERLAVDSVTSVSVDLPMYRGDVRVTRSELDDLAAGPLDGVTTALRELIDRGGGSADDLAGIALCGGGAAMSIVTQRLSTDFHTTVFVDADPGATAARGAAGLASTMAPRQRPPATGPLPPATGGQPPATGPLPPTDRRTPPRRAAGAAAAGAPAAAAAAAAGAGQANAAGPAGPPGPGGPLGPTGTGRLPVTGRLPAPGASGAWSTPPPPTSSRDLPAIPPPDRPSNAVTFGARDDHGDDDADSGRSRAKLIALIGGVVVAFVLVAGGVAYALSGDRNPEAPAPGTSVSEFTTPSTTSSTVETTEEVPTQEEFVPDQGGGDGGVTTTEPSSSPEDSVSVAPDSVVEPPPPVTGGGGTTAPIPTPTE